MTKLGRLYAIAGVGGLGFVDVDVNAHAVRGAGDANGRGLRVAGCANGRGLRFAGPPAATPHGNTARGSAQSTAVLATHKAKPLLAVLAMLGPDRALRVAPGGSGRSPRSVNEASLAARSARRMSATPRPTDGRASTRMLAMLRIYATTLDVARDAADLATRIARKDADLAKQLRRAAASVALNTADAV